jgi:MAF protein
LHDRLLKVIDATVDLGIRGRLNQFYIDCSERARGERLREYVRIQPMIVLASNSPRRKQLLHLAGWDFLVVPAELDESILAGETAQDYVTRLAREKAFSAAAWAPPDSTVIAADTTVVYKEEILVKPESPAEAVEMLRKLCGECHQVYTGVTVLRNPDRMAFSGVNATDVFMRDYSDEEIQAYVETGDPLDKAGAYAIQHRGFDPVDHLEGCYTNVVGLPLCTVNRLLRQAGIEPPTEITAECEVHPHADCPAARMAMSSNM